METKEKETLELPIANIVYTTIGALIIVAGITAVLRLSKTMISDMKAMGL
ncbi:MAG: hypothetical protein ACI9SJ_002374 [Flavobacteriaceae bacterium]|jgi:hypothetical protein